MAVLITRAVTESDEPGFLERCPIDAQKHSGQAMKSGSSKSNPGFQGVSFMLGSSFEHALGAALLQGPDARLLCVRKTVVAIEKRELRPTHRLCAALRLAINSIADDPAAEPTRIQECAIFHQRVRAFDPRRASAQPEKIADSFASRIFGDIPDRTDDDIWDSAPPLPLAEALRLSFLRGADPRALILAALDGRDFSLPVLLKLHSHMQRSFDAGGTALASGPLFSELERILTAQNVLPAIDPLAKTYGEELMEELEARN
jgi:hypothetical protein